MGPHTNVHVSNASPIYIKTAFLNIAQSYVSRDTDHTAQNLNITKMLYKCDHCDYKSERIWCINRHTKTHHRQQESASSCAHCDYKSSNRKHMKNKRARKGDMTKNEIRNMINEGFHVFQLYMKMKLQPTGFEDEEMIEESINVFKHYMLNKIDE